MKIIYTFFLDDCVAEILGKQSWFDYNVRCVTMLLLYNLYSLQGHILHPILLSFYDQTLTNNSTGNQLSDCTILVWKS